MSTKNYKMNSASRINKIESVMNKTINSNVYISSMENRPTVHSSTIIDNGVRFANISGFKQFGGEGNYGFSISLGFHL